MWLCKVIIGGCIGLFIDWRVGELLINEDLKLIFLIEY